MIFKTEVRSSRREPRERTEDQRLGLLAYPAALSLMNRENRKRFLAKIEAEVRAQDALWEYKHPTVQLLLFESQA